MDAILLKDVMFEGKGTDILVVGNRIKSIAPSLECPSAKIIDCRGKAVIPGFVNMHTHSGMALMRGMCEDLPLKQWLDKVWKVEAFLDPEAIYWATRMSMLEMIKTGTTTFLDMYWMSDIAAQAVEKMGVRAFLTYNFLDNFNEEAAQKQKQECISLFEQSKHWPDNLRMAVSVHADYTTSDDVLVWAKQFARDKGLKYTGHFCETPSEVEDTIQRNGNRTCAHFDRLGLLDSDTILAHSLWLKEDEIKLLGERGVTVAHNVNSNLKIASGYRFLYNELRDAGVNVTLGTDSVVSSNNLDMREAMKTMALLQKAWRSDATALPLDQLMNVASLNGAKALGIEAGRIEEGALADLVLVNLRNEAFVPNFNFIGNLIYAANSSCIDSVIIDGKIVMEGRKVEGEDEIFENVERLAWKLKQESGVII